jgi:hypothetical protein
MRESISRYRLKFVPYVSLAVPPRDNAPAIEVDVEMAHAPMRTPGSYAMWILRDFWVDRHEMFSIVLDRRT